MTEVLASQRDLFDIPRDVAYLNCAYLSPLMKPAAAALTRGMTAEMNPWTIKVDDFFSPVEGVRTRFARLIGARVDDIALVPSASYGLATAANNMALAAGQEIVTLEDQYPSNVYVWKRRAEETGAKLVIVPRPGDDDWTRAVIDHIGPNTAVAALPHNHWMDGGFLNLVEISRRLKQQGAALVIDASQSLGALPFDVGEIDPDFLVTAGYKWMLCPYGQSFLYAAPRCQGGRPLEENPMNRKEGEDFPTLARLRADYAVGARRFDVGERAAFTLLPATSVALDHLLQWDPARIQARLSGVTAGIAAEARRWGLTSVPQGLRAGHFLGLKFPDGVPAGLPEALAASKVFVSVRGASLRVTPNIYNDDADTARLLEVLDQVMGHAGA